MCITITSAAEEFRKVESFKPGLIHFALNNPYYAPMTSSLASSKIPITQPYPDVIVDLRGLGLGLELGLGLGLGSRTSSSKPNVSACAARPFHDVIATRHY